MRLPRAVLLLALLVAGCGGDDPDRGPPNAAELVGEAGCTACHRIGAQGNKDVGGDLNAVGKTLNAAAIRKKLLAPPAGMPSYGHLTAGEVDAIASYLAGLR